VIVNRYLSQLCGGVLFTVDSLRSVVLEVPTVVNPTGSAGRRFPVLVVDDFRFGYRGRALSLPTGRCLWLWKPCYVCE